MFWIFEKGEIFLLAGGIIVLIFIYKSRPELELLPDFSLFISSFFTFFSGWVFTVVEGLAFVGFFNFLEHTFYFIGSLLLAIWVYRVFLRER